MPHKRAKKSIRDAETAKKGSNLAPSIKATNPIYDDTPKSASRIISGWKFQSEFRNAGRTNSEDKGGAKPPTPSSSSSLKNGQSSKSKPTTTFSQPNEKGKEKEVQKIPSIQPHESLGEYNRRIEDLMRSGVSKAIKDAASIKALELSQARKDKKERKKRMRLEKLIKDGKLPKEALDTYLKELKEKKRKREDGDEGEDEDEEEDGEDDEKKTKPIKEFKSLEPPRRLNDIVQAPPQLPHLRKSGQAKTTSKEAYSAIGKNSSRLPLNLGQKRILEEERERVVKMYRDMKAKKEEERAKELTTKK